MKIPLKYKEKYEKLESVRRALCVKTRYEVAEEFNMPYEMVREIARYFELDTRSATFERRYQKVVARLESAESISRTELFAGLAMSLDEKDETLKRIEEEQPDLLKRLLPRNFSNRPLFVKKRERLQKMKEIVERGGRVTLQEIGDKLGVTREVISQYSKELGLKFENGRITKRSNPDSTKTARKTGKPVKVPKGSIKGKSKRK